MMSDLYRTLAFLYCSAVAVFAVYLVAEVVVEGLLSGVGVGRAVASDLFMGTTEVGKARACEVIEDSRVTLRLLLSTEIG
jgi:predicted GNAT superfamily acetyltransferase